MVPTYCMEWGVTHEGRGVTDGVDLYEHESLYSARAFASVIVFLLALSAELLPSA